MRPLVSLLGSVVALGSVLLPGACSDEGVEYSFRVREVIRQFDDLAALETEWGHEVIFPEVPQGFELTDVVLTPHQEGPGTVVTQWNADEREDPELTVMQRPGSPGASDLGEELEVAGTSVLVGRFPEHDPVTVNIDWRSCERDFRVVVEPPEATEEQGLEVARSLIRQC